MSTSIEEYLRDQAEMFEAQRNASITCYRQQISNVSTATIDSPTCSAIEETFPSSIDLLKRIVNLEKENGLLVKRMNETDSYLDQVDEYVYALETSVARLDQYGRRENIEISGIPNTVSNQQLEGEVINILQQIGLTHMDSYSIVGCHRISGKDRHGNKNTIVRFLHRKDAIDALKRRKTLSRCESLRFKNLWMSENLCPAFKSVFDSLETLKKQGTVSKYWSRYGKLHYKLRGSENIHNISHILDIEHLFGD